VSLTHDRLAAILAKAQSDGARHDPRALQSLASSPDPDQRLLALAHIRTQVGQGEPPEPYLSTARQLVGDSDNDCRWQALIVIGEAIRSSPETAWEVVVDSGSSPDEDMRNAVATVLLEHLLEEQFELYFPSVRDRVLSRDRLFQDTLSRCWVSTSGSPHRARVQHLLDVAAHGGLSTDSGAKDAV
jgi:hypothetical protein